MITTFLGLVSYFSSNVELQPSILCISYTKSFHSITYLAPSPAVLAYLARNARSAAGKMALITTEQPEPKRKPTPEPCLTPPVLTTPCDPWPRPYYLEDGLRKVRPYYFTYNTYCKARWRGRELLDIFATEFRDRPLEYYVCRVGFFCMEFFCFEKKRGREKNSQRKEKCRTDVI